MPPRERFWDDDFHQKMGHVSSSLEGNDYILLRLFQKEQVSSPES